MSKPKDPAKLEAYYARDRARKATPRELAARRARYAAKNALAGTVSLPEGHRLKGVSVLTDESGKLRERWDKTERDSTPEGEKPAVPPTFAITKQSRFTDAQGTVRGMWTAYEQARVDADAAMREAFAKLASEYEFAVPRVRAPETQDRDVHIVIPLGDPHIGMLAWAPEVGESFDLKIAERDLMAAVDLTVEGAPSARTCSIVNLGDFFHVQDNTQRTPNGGNKLDGDGRFLKTLEVGTRMCERMCERALERFERVNFFMVPGNHDPLISQVFAQMFARAMRDNPRLNVPSNLDPFMVEEFGANMFLYHHTDGVKLADSHRIMSGRHPEMWGRTRHRYAHGGHIHHAVELTRKEDAAVIAEAHNTLAGRDAWHHSKGYDAKRLTKCIAYHVDDGEIARHTITLGRVRRLRGG